VKAATVSDERLRNSRHSHKLRLKTLVQAEPWLQFHYNSTGGDRGRVQNEWESMGLNG